MVPSAPEMVPSTVHSLNATMFHIMGFKLSLEINNDTITAATTRSFLNVLYNVCKISKKHINIEQYNRLQLDGPKIAVCETTSNAVFIIDSSFTKKDHLFHTALEEAQQAFNPVMLEFGYHQKLEQYNPDIHQTNPPPQHILY